jgi:hypothetical protein
VKKSITVGAALAVFSLIMPVHASGLLGGTTNNNVNANTNANANTNVNTNANTNLNTNLNSNVQGQVQGQSQRQNQGQVQGQSLRNKNTATGGNAAATGGSSAARGGDQSQGQSVDNTGVGANSNNYQQSGIPVSSAVAPSFAIGGCQWAFSGGLQLFGAGVSAGSAGMYEFCKALMKSKHMSDQGKGHVAKALECQDSSIRAAYKSVGDPCIEDMPRQVAAANGAATPALVPVVAANNTLPPNCKLVQPGNYVTCQ